MQRKLDKERVEAMKEQIREGGAVEIQSAVRRWLCGRVCRPLWRERCEVMAAEKMRKEREKKAWLARMEAEEKE